MIIRRLQTSGYTGTWLASGAYRSSQVSGGPKQTIPNQAKLAK